MSTLNEAESGGIAYPLTASIFEISLSLKDRLFYMEVWRGRNHVCECCGEPLYEPRLFMFHHILEKRAKKFSHVNYTMFRHCLWNIMLLCWQCHDAYERHDDTRPKIVAAKHLLLSYLAQEYEYDKHDIWIKGETVDLNPIHQIFGSFPIKLTLDGNQDS